MLNVIFKLNNPYFMHLSVFNAIFAKHSFQKLVKTVSIQNEF
ncbi:hypothetical protein AC564_2004 [Lacticaseibacillus paracasei]|nr:hypothetical protein AC564_2004 [Lacticaseibacillus paracasei]